MNQLRNNQNKSLSFETKELARKKATKDHFVIKSIKIKLRKTQISSRLE